jgi:LEA14-like dessication related protein
MKKISVIFILSIIIIFTSCISYKDVEYKGIENFALGNPFKDNMPIHLDIIIDNPNNYNIKIKKAEFEIYMNTTKLGKSTLDRPITLEKNKTKSYPITIITSSKEIGKSLLSSLGLLIGKKVKIKVKGNLIAKVFGIRKKIDFNFNEAINASQFLR